MAQTWDIDPKTGDYIMVGGSPKQTNELTVPAYFRLKTKRTQWLYAPDSDFGSDYFTVQKRRTTDNANTVEAIGSRALQPLVNDGRASEITVTAVTVTRNSVGLQTDITDARGQVTSITLPQV